MAQILRIFADFCICENSQIQRHPRSDSILE